MTASPSWLRINLVCRCKLYIAVALLAFFAGVISAPAGRQAVREAAAFLRGQFDGNCANDFFPC